MKQRLLVRSSVDVLHHFSNVPMPLKITLLLNTVLEAAIGYVFISYSEQLLAAQHPVQKLFAQDAGYGALAMSILSLMMLIAERNVGLTKAGLTVLTAYHIGMTSSRAAAFTQGTGDGAILAIHLLLGLSFAVLALKSFKERTATADPDNRN